ncbi:MAG: HEAT repeat domain-containing protein [Anaerolineaceae bacterium]|nr:HEAT repeat domain-containing protein [Anaerolineaceae bacterium]
MVDTSESPNTENQQIRLAQQLNHQFNRQGIRGLCFQLQIDHENLPGETKREIAQELVLYCIRHGRIAELESVITQTLGGRQDKLTEYRQHLLNETRYLELKGIPLPPARDGRPRDPKIPLDEIYIRLQAIASEEQELQERQEEKKIGGAAVSASDFLGPMRQLGEYYYRRGQLYRAEERPESTDPQQALLKHKRLVVLGAPGAGKSTMLRYLARRAAEQEDTPLPLLVSLRDYATACSQDSQLTLRQFALQQAAAGDRLLQEAMAQVVEQGRALWLLDALDEARELAGEAARQASRLPGQLILTSRPLGYMSNSLHSLPHFELLPIAPENVETFLCNWLHLVVEELADQPEVIQGRVANLQAQLVDRPRLQALTRNPLLLTFLVTLASREAVPELPVQRSSLYARYLEELLSWEINRQEANNDFQLGDLRGKAARRTVQDGLLYLGWTLHLQYYGGQAQAPPDKTLMVNTLAAFLSRDGVAEPENLAEELFTFWQTAGLLDVWHIGEHTYLTFRHLTFQEYAVAWGLNKAWQRDERAAWRFLQPRLHHPAWREPILLLVGLMNDQHINQLVHNLLRGLSPDERSLHRDLRLAGTLLAERPLDEEDSRKILRRLDQLIQGRTWFKRIRPFADHQPIFTLLSEIGPMAIPILLTMLESGTDTVRHRAAKALGEIGDTVAVPVLITALNDKDWFLRSAAAEALGKIGDTTALFPLIHGLRFTESYERNSIVSALWEIKDEALPILIAALRDSDWHVRSSAAEALGEVGDATVTSALVTTLGDSDKFVRSSAAEALGKIRDVAAVSPLITALGDSDSHVRSSSAESLGQIGDVAAVPTLVTALGGSDWSLKDSAAKALGQIRDVAAVLPLITALGDKNSYVSSSAALALGQIGDKAAVPPLIAALGETGEIPYIRLVDGIYLCNSAAIALGKIGDEAAIPVLITALGDKNSLSERSVVEALKRVGEAAVPVLIAALEDNNNQVRNAAAKVLGKIGNVTAIPALITALSDSKSNVRNEAAEALGEIGDAIALPPLIIALDDNDWHVRRSVAEALGKIGDATAVPALVTALGDGVSDVRRNAARALADFEDVTAMPALIKALSDSDSDVRKSAVLGIARIGDTAALPHFITALRDSDKNVRHWATMLLENLIATTEDERLLRHVRKALWWRLLDSDASVAEDAFRVLEKVRAILTLQEVARLPLRDPLLIS